jgi:hypothetical protein
MKIGEKNYEEEKGEKDFCKESAKINDWMVRVLGWVSKQQVRVFSR